jgi:hypothetical protein
MEATAVAVCGVTLESLTCIEKFEVPAVVGVPVTAPVAGFRLRPAGSELDEMLHT